MIRQVSILSIWILMVSLSGSELGSVTGASFIPSADLLKDASGPEIKKIISSYEGEKAVLVNVWATWCVPCVEEFPDIVKLQHKYADRLQVVFISADFPDRRDQALEFLKEHDVDWTTYFKTGKDQPFIEALSGDWSGALPFTKVINKEGTVIASWENKATFSKFEMHVKHATSP